MRLSGHEVAELLGDLLRGPAGSLKVGGWLGAPLTALDEAVTVHLAQMSAAAVERAQLYGAGA